jgi:hypothetical protein
MGINRNTVGQIDFWGINGWKSGEKLPQGQPGCRICVIKGCFNEKER